MEEGQDHKETAGGSDELSAVFSLIWCSNHRLLRREYLLAQLDVALEHRRTPARRAKPAGTLAPSCASRIRSTTTMCGRFTRGRIRNFARVRKGTMSRTDFEAWERTSEELRDWALTDYERTESEEQRGDIVEQLAEELNQA